MGQEQNVFEKVSVDKRKGHDIKLDAGNLKNAYRLTKNLPQAILKVSSYSSGASRVGAHLDYISRKGEIQLEDPQGNQLRTKKEHQERLDEWSMDFDKRKNSRDTVNIVLSAPKGSKSKMVKKSVKEFAKKNFSDNHDYLFAIHNDTDFPHGHLVIKMRGYDGKKLNPGRKDLREWRERFASSLRENGVEVDASPRLARGVGRKSSRQNLIHLRERKTPNVDKEAVKDVIRDIGNKINQQDKPWSSAAKKRTEKYTDSLKEVAKSAKNAAILSHNKNLNEMAESIYEFSEMIPEPKTRAEEYQEKLTKQQDKDRER